jgi:hypothetical protein
MFNFLKSLFDRFYTKKEDSIPKDPNNLLIISVDNYGQIRVKITINNTDNNAGKKFGEMLFLLNEGYCTQSILDIFDDIVESEASYGKFLRDVIDRWSSKITESEKLETDQSDKPIISPTFFYKGSK